MSTPNCERCDTPMEQWPTGLCSEDREQGMFTGTSHICPNCVDEWHFTGHLAPEGGSSSLLMMRDGIQINIIWYWWDAEPLLLRQYMGRGQTAQPTHITEFMLEEK